MLEVDGVVVERGFLRRENAPILIYILGFWLRKNLVLGAVLAGKMAESFGNSLTLLLGARLTRKMAERIWSRISLSLFLPAAILAGEVAAPRLATSLRFRLCDWLGDGLRSRLSLTLVLAAILPWEMTSPRLATSLRFRLCDWLGDGLGSRLSLALVLATILTRKMATPRLATSLGFCRSHGFSLALNLGASPAGVIASPHLLTCYGNGLGKSFTLFLGAWLAGKMAEGIRNWEGDSVGAGS
jgi:hypothetical protein